MDYKIIPPKPEDITIVVDGKEYGLVPKSSPAKEPERDWEVTEELKVCFEGYWTGKTEIFKVRRLSDGVVFSVGDEVDSTWGKQIITDFEIYKDVSMIVGFKTCKNPLEKIRKLPERTNQTGSVSQQISCMDERIAYIEKILKIDH